MCNSLLTAFFWLMLAPYTFAAPSVTSLLPPLVLGKAKTIQCKITIQMATLGIPAEKHPVFVGSLAVELPNKVAERDADQRTGEVNIAFVSDGKNLISYNKEHNVFYRSIAPVNWTRAHFNSLGLPDLWDFLTTDDFQAFRKTGATVIEGKPTAQYRKQLKEALFPGIYSDVWIESKTGLPVRLTVSMVYMGKVYEMKREDFSDWKLNEKIDPAIFAYTAPKSAKENPSPE